MQQAAGVIQAIHAAASPEEAARTGRAAQRQRPELVRPDWDTAKLAVMEAALRAKVRDVVVGCCTYSRSSVCQA